MSGNKNNNRRPTEIAAGVVIGAGAVYGAYKLFQSMFGTEDPQPNKSLPRHQMYEDKCICCFVKTVDQLERALMELKSYVFQCVFSKKNS